MKTFKKALLLCFSVVISLVFAGSAHAATLSQTSVSLSTGQSLTVYAYNVSNYVYLSNSSNSRIASVSVSGSNINIYALTTGNTTATICESNIGNCNTLYITVNSNSNYGGGYYNNNNGLSLNISNLVLPVGSNITITTSNPSGMYISSNSSPNVASTLNVGVSGTSGCTNGTQYSPLTGQPCSNQYNNGGSYNSSYVPGCTINSQYSVLTGQPCNNQTNGNNSSAIEILAVSAGSDTVSFCQSNSTICSNIYVTVF